MELAVVEHWNDAAVFMDFGSRRLMTFHEHTVNVVDIDSHTRSRFELPEVTQLSCIALSPKSDVLAFVQDLSRLVSLI
jgi:hypothetical protein